MASVSRIVRLGLENVVAECQSRGLTTAETLAELNSRHDGKPIRADALRSFIKANRQAAAAVAHRPAISEAQLTRTINVADQITFLHGKLREWIEEAEAAREIKLAANGTPHDAGPNWQARIGVARELRQHTEFYVDVLEKVYSADQVRSFQEEVLAAIREESPETAAKIVERMRSRQTIRQAALLGAVR